MNKKQQQQQGPKCANRNCACNKCFKSKPEAEKAAAAWWRELYARNGWERDNLGYL